MPEKNLMKKNSAVKKCIVVPHTHWDREWYVTFEEFRVRLVKMLDELIDICQNDSDFVFTLDGQTIVLDDYLEVRPQQREILAELVRNQQIFIGPWYTQCDTRLVSGESIIRNLLFGTTSAKNWGNVAMIGYLPDNFGNIGQLPQILAGFGIHNFISGRGIDCSANEFKFVGDDGTVAVGVFQRFGYPTYDLDRRLESKDNAVKKFQENINRLEEFELSDTILLSPGGDHCFPEAKLPKFVDYAAKALNVEMKTGSYEDYIKRLDPILDQLPEIRGELNIAASRYVHASGVLACRMPVKRQNKRLEDKLAFYTEPLSLLADQLAGKHYEDKYIELAWKNLLQNHAHDSIYGCCIDKVFHDVNSRFFKVDEITTQVINGAMNAVGTAVKPVKNELTRILAFNPLPFQRREVIETTIVLPEKIRRFALVDADEEPILANIEKVSARETVQNSLAEERREYKIRFREDIPAMGYKSFYIVESPHPIRPQAPAKNIAPKFENSYYRAEITDHGCLDLWDKSSGKTYSNLGYFTDGGNTGDLFTYSPPPQDSIISSLERKIQKITVLHSGDEMMQVEVRLSLKVPKRLTKDKRTRVKETAVLPLTLFYTFYSAVSRIDVKCTFDSQILNHRLRVHFPVGENVEFAEADAPFFTVRRKSGSEGYPFIWDKPQGLHPAHGFVQAGKNPGLTIMTGEVSQYEVSDTNSEIILTLLLATGKFRECKNVWTRKKSWDQPLLTPDAQCQGMHSYHYSIIPGNDNAARQQALSARFPVRTECFNYEKGDLPACCSMISLDNPEIRLSAFKKHHLRNSIILRLYNPRSDSLTTKLQVNLTGYNLWRYVSLAETPLFEPKKLKDDFLELRFAGGEIKTIELLSL